MTSDAVIKNRERLGLFVLGELISGVFIIFIIVTALFNLVSIGFILFFCMAATITLSLTVPVFVPLSNWSLDTYFQKPFDMIQINATVIAGILIFLTINASTTQNGGQNVQVKELFNTSKISLPRVALIAAFTTLTIIPFALSSIIVLVWGSDRVRKDSVRKADNPETNLKTASIVSGAPGETTVKWGLMPTDDLIRGQIVKHELTGVKWGAIFMVAGFIWIIISMIIFVMIIFT
jgi:hypothetical protein